MLICQSNICDNFNIADERFSRPKNVFRLYLQRLCFKLFSNFFYYYYFFAFAYMVLSLTLVLGDSRRKIGELYWL